MASENTLDAALRRLRAAVSATAFPLDIDGSESVRTQRQAVLDQLDDYILPRLARLDAPLLTVVGGSTGAGKSTLVNTLVGRVVSRPGVLRPTTRSPVLVHHPVDAGWFSTDRILPGLARVTGDLDAGLHSHGLQLVASDTLPPGLAILDAPDIDSVVEANRTLAAQLLAAADLWVFVTTASRYADAVPWGFLREAAERSMAVAIVLDRVPEDAGVTVAEHLHSMLIERGLKDSPVFSILESEVDADGLLPRPQVAQLHDWLTALAADAEARGAVVRGTLDGAIASLVTTTPELTKGLAQQQSVHERLIEAVTEAYARANRQVEKSIEDGSLMRGEVLARWQEFVGTGELLKGLERRVGTWRDKLIAAISGRPVPKDQQLAVAVESGLTSLLRAHAEAAAEQVVDQWQGSPAGRQALAAGARDLGRTSREFDDAANRAIRAWQGHVLQMVSTQGADKRATARVLSYGVNGLGVVLMIVVFAHTAFIPTGAEVGVGAGTAMVGQKLLEAVFGDQAVRRLAAEARADLQRRVAELYAAESARFEAAIAAHAPVDQPVAAELTAATAGLSAQLSRPPAGGPTEQGGTTT